MALVSLNYVFGQFANEGYRFWSIKDEEGVIQMVQNAAIEPERSLTKLRNFFRENEGVFTIDVYSGRIADGNRLAQMKKHVVTFKVDAASHIQQGGLSGMQMGMTGLGSLAYDDPRANAPNIYGLMERSFMSQMENKLMEKDYEYKIRELERRMEDVKNEAERSRGMGAIVEKLGSYIQDPAVLLGLISGIKEMFSSPNQMAPIPVGRPIQGIEEDIVSKQVQNNNEGRQQSLINSVNYLNTFDTNFPENMVKLAHLAKNKPQMYQMAVNFLNNL
jgi:hypothetical protein